MMKNGLVWEVFGAVFGLGLEARPAPSVGRRLPGTARILLCSERLAYLDELRMPNDPARCRDPERSGSDRRRHALPLRILLRLDTMVAVMSGFTSRSLSCKRSSATATKGEIRYRIRESIRESMLPMLPVPSINPADVPTRNGPI
jgi:hypothetical protein